MPQDRDNLPLRLPALRINYYDIKQSSSIKFLGVLVDEHLSWIDHINTLENKLSKNFDLLYKAKPFLNAKTMKNLYFPFFHSYLIYGSIAWCRTSTTKLKKIYRKKKQVVKTYLDYENLKSEERMDKLGILNIYTLNIYHTVNLVYIVKNNTIPEAFQTRQDTAKITLKNLK